MIPIHTWIFFVVLLAMAVTVVYCMRSVFYPKKEGFATTAGSRAFTSEADYKKQVKALTDRFGATADAHRPVTENLASMPETQQNLVNFYALGARFTGYIGPLVEGYFDPEIAVQTAVNAGCRVFVLEIDYLNDCASSPDTKYFPRLVVRDVHGRLLIRPSSNEPFCNSASASNLREVCEKINTYAFASSSDPVILVLYFLRQPPGGYKAKDVLDYYSNVAKMLAPLRERFLGNEVNGGTFYRQSQESRLLMNNITTYSNKVLVFSNANLLGFRESPIKYKPEEDLDFMTNLRLSYTQTQLGITSNDSIGPSFGILQAAEDYLAVPTDRTDQVVEQTKSRWTIALSSDPSKPVDAATFQKLVSTFGVQCVPISVFDETNQFMFTEGTFKTYSYQPKPPSLRFIKPPIVVPAEPNPSMNANGGKLRAPTLGE